MRQPVVIALLAVPILIQVYFNAGLAYWLNRRLGVAWCVAGPSALIGPSNFFELAVATAIALFGFQSGAALATVVGCWSRCRSCSPSCTSFGPPAAGTSAAAMSPLRGGQPLPRDTVGCPQHPRSVRRSVHRGFTNSPHSPR